ncbi:MAG: acyl-CoA dehydrogenase family protein [Actinomycetia bacterium]|nr:acyl-CoA dehydrogenase family protein [Actinomycetes bacterium]
MDFNLSSEQKAMQKLCIEFAENEIAPKAQEMDRTGEFPYEIIKKMAKLGLMGLPIPKKYGGVGTDYLTYVIALEEISKADASVGITMSAHISLPCSTLYDFGTEEQKQKWLVPLAQGKILGAFGLTEPSAGSDAGATQTTAELIDEKWVINGSKCFITNSGTDISGLVIVTAVTGKREDGRSEISNFIIPRETEGYSQGPKYAKMGWRAADTRELIFSDCKIPKENLLGDLGSGFRQFLQVLDAARISMAALSVGVAQACLDASLKYAKERIQFGRPISKFQAISFKLADMATEIELARLMYYKAAWLKDNGKPYTKEATMAKLFASEISVKCANEAVQIHGGYGFMDDFDVSRYYRDVKVNTIGEGTSEIQRIVIARQLGC